MVLTHSPEDSPTRLQALSQPEETTLTSEPVRPLAISPPQYRQTLHQYDQDVVRELSLPPESATSGIRRYPTSNGSHSLRQTETQRFLTPYNALAYSSARPRTPPVNLIAQHGLPSSLPPPPRTTFISQQHPIPPAQETQSLVTALHSLYCNSYSAMLSNKSDSVMNTTTEELPQGGESSRAVKHNAVLTPVCPSFPLRARPLAVEIDPSSGFSLDEVLQSNLWEDFLTSPQLDDSPEETPYIDTPLDDLNTSPMIGFGDDSFGLENMPLFGAEVTAGKEADDAAVAEVNESLLNLLGMYTPQEATATDSFDASKVESVTPALPPLDQAMYTIPSTPSYTPASLHLTPGSNQLALAPSTSSLAVTAQSSRVAKPVPTGTRRNITPSALVPLDAPTQPRQYVTPSATSRKVVPAAFVKGKKRGRSELPEDDEEDIDISHLDPNTKEAIEAKRRQNTLAARRSRQRKLEHVRELEDAVQNLAQDRDMWMQRAYQAEEKLRVNGIS